MGDDERLIEAARAAWARSYSPYSRFAVGAAVLTRAGDIVTGSNVENASYGLTLCAERVALSRALQEGHAAGDILAVAVATDAPAPVTPCGACRQWLAELAPTAIVHCAGRGDSFLTVTVADLLPYAFGARDLGG